jgi:hypothetical protein
MSRETAIAKNEISSAAAEAVKAIAQAANDATKVVAAAAAEATKVSNKKCEDDNNANVFTSFIYKQGTLIVAIVGVCFVVYFTFANPAKDNDTALQLQEQRIVAQEQTITTITKTQQNDTQEVKANIAALTVQVNNNNIVIEKLSTIIEERLPKTK